MPEEGKQNKYFAGKKPKSLQHHFEHEEIESKQEGAPKCTERFPQEQPPRPLIQCVRLTESGRPCSVKICHPEGGCMPGATWTASSLVGVRTRAAVTATLLSRCTSCCNMGNANAAVFPEPVSKIK